MADGGNDRGVALRNGPNHGFFVEAPQVFQAASAPAHNQKIQKAAGIGSLDLIHDLRNGVFTLNEGRENQNAPCPVASPEDADEVADGRTSGGGNDAHGSGECRNGFFAVSAE